ncbi:MAG: hypothetical protein ABIA02_01770 [Candidatus Falkowbacteria bacterium]
MKEKIKKFAKENWFKLGLLLLVGILMLAISYYFVVEIPRTNKVQEERLAEKTLFDEKVQCANEVDNLRNRIPEVRRDFELIEAHFNENFNTCYAYVLDSNSDTAFYIVYDVFKATEVLQFAVTFGDETKVYGPAGIDEFSDIDIAAHDLMYRK